MSKYTPWLISLLWLAGCSVEEALDHLAQEVKKAEQTASQDAANSASATTPSSIPPVAGDKVRLASFNIQVLGTSKMGKPEVVKVLADVIRHFDVVAIQEIRAKEQTIIEDLVAQVNATGRSYDYVLGPRLGRTSSKEQYAFVFDAQRIEVSRESVFTVPDPQDLLHREPLVASFRVRGLPPSEAFTFTLMNIHTDPDETDLELDALGDFFVQVQRSVADDDVIVLGDLNVDEYHLGKLGQLPGIGYAISGVPTNTRGSKSYDNLVYDRRYTTEATGVSGVFNLLTEYQLTMDQALDVSDHMPVWAEFSAREVPAMGPVASRPGAANQR